MQTFPMDALSEIFFPSAGQLAVALGLVGIVFIVLGLKLSQLSRRAFNRGTLMPVTVNIVAVHQEAGSGSGGQAFRSEYEVASGPYKGLRRKSEITSDPPMHETGETCPGCFDRRSGALESRKALGVMVWLIRACVAGGGLAMIAAGWLWFVA